MRGLKFIHRGIILTYLFLLIILYKMGLPTISEEIPLLNIKNYFSFATIFSSIENGRLAITGSFLRNIFPSNFGFYFLLNILNLLLLFKYFEHFIKINEKNKVFIIIFISFLLTPSLSNILLNIRNLESLYILPLCILFVIEYKLKKLNLFHYVAYAVLLNYLIYFKETNAFSFIFYYFVIFIYRNFKKNKNFLYMGLTSCTIYLFVYYTFTYGHLDNSLIIEKLTKYEINTIYQIFNIFLKYLYSDLILILFLFHLIYKFISLNLERKYSEACSYMPIFFCIIYIMIHIFVGAVGHYLIVLYPIVLVMVYKNKHFNTKSKFLTPITVIYIIFISIPSLVENIEGNIFNRINFDNVTQEILKKNKNGDAKNITILEDGASFFQIYAFNEIFTNKNKKNFKIKILNDMCGIDKANLDERLLNANIPRKIDNTIVNQKDKNFFNQSHTNYISECSLEKILKSDYIIYLERGIYNKDTFDKIKKIDKSNIYSKIIFDDGFKFNINFIKKFIKMYILNNSRINYNSSTIILYTKYEK
jgi:hypothetical protein